MISFLIGGVCISVRKEDPATKAPTVDHFKVNESSQGGHTKYSIGKFAGNFSELVRYLQRM